MPSAVHQCCASEPASCWHAGPAAQVPDFWFDAIDSEAQWPALFDDVSPADEDSWLQRLSAEP